jgi:hypothetical protein
MGNCHLIGLLQIRPAWSALKSSPGDCALFNNSPRMVELERISGRKKAVKTPRERRIPAISDTFDPTTSNWPYHICMPVVDALDELARYRGKYFYPDMVDAFFQSYHQSN